MDDRLLRIEEKIDKLSEAIVSLARMEERMITLFKRMDTYDSQQAVLADRVDVLETETTRSSVIFTWGDRIATAGITAFIAYLFMHNG